MKNLEATCPAPITDDETSLIRGIVAGDRALFEKLMRRYNRRLYRWRVPRYATRRKRRSPYRRLICRPTGHWVSSVAMLPWPPGLPAWS